MRMTYLPSSCKARRLSDSKHWNFLEIPPIQISPILPYSKFIGAMTHPHNNLSTMALLTAHVYYWRHGDVIICCYILNRPREKHLQFEILYTIIIVVADQLITGRSWRHVEIYYSILFLGNWQCQLMNKLH